MIIECPECGTKNQTTQPPQPGKKYRCGKCGATITFLQTNDTQDTIAEIPKEKTRPEEREDAKKRGISMKRIGMGVGFGFIAFILITVLIGLLTSGDKTEESPLTSSEQAYATTMADHIRRFSEVTSNLSHLFLNPQIGNDEWALDIAVQLAKQLALYDVAMGIDAPSSMANIHYTYMQAMYHSEAANHLIARWLDDPDNLNLLEQATAEVQTSGQLLVEAASLMEVFNESRGIR